MGWQGHRVPATLIGEGYEHEFIHNDWDEFCWQLVVLPRGAVVVCNRREEEYPHITISPDDGQGY